MKDHIENVLMQGHPTTHTTKPGLLNDERKISTLAFVHLVEHLEKTKGHHTSAPV